MSCCCGWNHVTYSYRREKSYSDWWLKTLGNPHRLRGALRLKGSFWDFVTGTPKYDDQQTLFRCLNTQCPRMTVGGSTSLRSSSKRRHSTDRCRECPASAPVGIGTRVTVYSYAILGVFWSDLEQNHKSLATNQRNWAPFLGPREVNV